EELLVERHRSREVTLPLLEVVGLVEDGLGLIGDRLLGSERQRQGEQEGSNADLHRYLRGECGGRCGRVPTKAGHERGPVTRPDRRPHVTTWSRCHALVTVAPPPAHRRECARARGTCGSTRDQHVRNPCAK